MNYSENPDPKSWPGLLLRPATAAAELEAQVLPVMEAVKQRGDAALFELTKKFDQVELTSLLLPDEEKTKALDQLAPELREAIDLAAANIRRFHEAQFEKPFVVETQPGVLCSRRSVPVERVGLYIPGGSAPLFSTVLMLGIPAQLAGCTHVVLCTPPSKTGIHPATIYAAQVCGIGRIYTVGGAQAIAAMAFGTETVPRVYKIFGPGNQYVTAAKKLVAKEGIPIDMPAGPSELAVLADETAVPAFVAADLLSQAEHGPDSQVLLVSVSEAVLHNVLREVETQLETLPRKTIAAEALKNSLAVRVKDTETAMALLNEYAAEHLILACADAEQCAGAVVNAGSVFLGNWSPESAGDYASGTNHTLPTNGFARAYSGVSLDSFMKKITFQQLSREGLSAIGKAVEVMAAAEGLEAHKRAVTLRLDAMKGEDHV